MKKSWISAHPRVVIGILLVVCLGPFLNKAIHVDDALYVWTGQWIQKHPLDFFGFKVNWWFSAIPISVANWNPPLMSYYLAGVGSLFGWHEIVLHLGGLAVAFAAAAGIYSLAQMWCDRPLLATVIALLTPVFLVSSTTLMCDVLMLTFWIWALVFWERALAGGKQAWWRFLVAGVLAGLAVLTKYSAVPLLPLLPILSLLRTRKLGWWLLGLAVPLLMVAGYEWMTAQMYGTGQFSTAVAHTHHSREFPSSWGARGIIGLAFAGGCLLPVLFFAPFLWRRRTLLVGSVVMLGIWLAMFPLWDNLGLITVTDPKTVKHWYYLLQVAFLAAGGLHLMLLAAVEVRQERNIISGMLALWIMSGLFSAIVVNFAVNARGFLPLVPAAAILVVRRWGAMRGNAVGCGWLLWPLIPAAAIALSVALADYQLARSGRLAAEQIAAKYKPANRQLWFEGHGAFQYYMEKLGGRPIDVERSLLQPGDVVAVTWISGRAPLPAGSVGWLEDLEFNPFSWMNLTGASKSGAAGFYGANWGPVPFAIGKGPKQVYIVVEVFSRVQFNTQPANPQEVQAGDVPSFPSISFSAEAKVMFQWKPEAIKQNQLASQFEAEGRIEEAIQHYREALNVDSNNPVVLNSLAWILATGSKPELRNGEEAMQLAAKAVDLTDGRVPRFIGTLAAAYARVGQFSSAIQTAQAASMLATVADQPEEAEQINKLLNLFAAGRAVPATHSP